MANKKNAAVEFFMDCFELSIKIVPEGGLLASDFWREVTYRVPTTWHWAVIDGVETRFKSYTYAFKTGRLVGVNKRGIALVLTPGEKNLVELPIEEVVRGFADEELLESTSLGGTADRRGRVLFKRSMRRSRAADAIRNQRMVVEAPPVDPWSCYCSGGFTAHYCGHRIHSGRLHLKY